MRADVAIMLIDMLNDESINLLEGQDAMMYLCAVGKNGENRFAPLGLVCEAYRLSTGEGAWDPAYQGTRRFYIEGKGGGIQFLPNAVMKWAGFDSTDPKTNGSKIRGSWDKMSLKKALFREAQMAAVGA